MSEAVGGVNAERTAGLPFTGLNTLQLIAMALALLIAGGAALLMTRRHVGSEN